MNKREEILKYMSLEELEKEIQTKKTELKGLISTDGCEFIIARELGIQIENTKKNEIQHMKSFSEKILFSRFSDFIESVEKNTNFLEELSEMLGTMFAHNKCCHQYHNLPDIEDIDFNEFIKKFKISYCEAKLSVNAEWFYQLKKPVNIEDKEEFERNEKYYGHRLEHLNMPIQKEIQTNLSNF